MKRPFSEVSVVIAVNGKHITIGCIRTESAAYMLISIFLILFTLALEIAPVFLYFLKEETQTALTQRAWIIIGSVLFLVFAVNSLIAVVLLRSGMRKFEKFQLS